jgi:hypothetical protein
LHPVRMHKPSRSQPFLKSRIALRTHSWSKV